MTRFDVLYNVLYISKRKEDSRRLERHLSLNAVAGVLQGMIRSKYLRSRVLHTEFGGVIPSIELEPIFSAVLPVGRLDIDPRLADLMTLTVFPKATAID